MTDQNTPILFDTTAPSEIDLTGRRAVVTGAERSPGREIALELALAGARVTLAVADLPAGLRVREQLVSETGNSTVEVAPLDLADPDTAFGRETLSHLGRTGEPPRLGPEQEH